MCSVRAKYLPFVKAKGVAGAWEVVSGKMPQEYAI